MPGKFIVIEGGDGSGKDTQINKLREALGREKFLFVKDPGDTEIGLLLRNIVLYNDAITPQAELLLYLASRAQLTEEKIRPALERGIHVISNRFSPSTIAYQIYGRQRMDDMELLKIMSEYVLKGLRPDHIIYLDCPAEVGLARVSQSGERADRFEQETVDFHTRVREGYKAVLAEYPHTIVDATRAPGDVYADVYAAVKSLIP
jgi:dTMP kinase